MEKLLYIPNKLNDSFGTQVNVCRKTSTCISNVHDVLTLHTMHEFYMGVPNCSLVCVDLHYLSMGCNAFINCRSNKKNCLTFLAAVFFICVKFVTILSNIWIHGSTKFFIYFEIMNITTPRGVGGGAGD
jgi:hypothetical protein